MPGALRVIEIKKAWWLTLGIINVYKLDKFHLKERIPGKLLVF